MSSSQNNYWKYVPRAIIWTVGTSLFALAPLIIVYVINIMSEEQIARREIQHLLADGIFLVTGCALTGSILFDFLVSKRRAQNWLLSIAIYVLPFAAIIFLFTRYLFMYIQLGDQHEFGPGTANTKLMLVILALYCVFVKTIYLARKDQSLRTHASNAHDN